MKRIHSPAALFRARLTCKAEALLLAREIPSWLRAWQPASDLPAESWTHDTESLRNRMHATLNYIMLRHSPQTFQAFGDGKIKAQTISSLPFPPSAQLELHLIWNTEQNMLFHCEKIQVQMDSALFHARSVPLHYLCLVQTRLALIVQLGKIRICNHAACQRY